MKKILFLGIIWEYKIDQKYWRYVFEKWRIMTPSDKNKEIQKKKKNMIQKMKMKSCGKVKQKGAKEFESLDVDCNWISFFLESWKKDLYCYFRRAISKMILSIKMSKNNCMHWFGSNAFF